jgi:TetR/AcrR family transcriptional repressor of nem operon
LEQALDDSPTTEEFLRRVFAEVVKDASSKNPKGCLMSNSASEFGQHETAFRREVRGAFQTVQRFLEAVLKQGVKNGEVTTDDPPRLLAQYLVTTLSGVRAMVKGGMKPTEARTIVDKTLRAVLA